MMAIVSFFLSPIGRWVGIAIVALIAAGIIRQHYINVGWEKAIVAVKKQDDKAKAAATEVERKVGECADDNYWDVITQGCKGVTE